MKDKGGVIVLARVPEEGRLLGKSLEPCIVEDILDVVEPLIRCYPLAWQQGVPSPRSCASTSMITGAF